MTNPRRKQRSRPVPKWLLKQSDLDAIAQRRVLMILGVLSGIVPVSAAIAEAKISRGLYYQLETKALNAMLLALDPGTESSEEKGAGTKDRIRALEEKIERLERDKRRLERLGFLTQKLVRGGPLTTGAGRPPKRRSSTKDGPSASRRSTKKKAPRTPTSSVPKTETVVASVAPR
jgi:hypothetical protein